MKRKNTVRTKRRIIFLCSAAIIAGLLYFNGFSDLTAHSAYHDGQIKVACIGDSTTYGFAIKNQPEYSYPAVLGKMLGDDYHVCNFGNIRVTVQPDADQPYINTYTYSDSIEYNADIIVFMMGTNDSKTINWQGPEKFKADCITLIDSYLCDGKHPQIYLCSPPDAILSDKSDDNIAAYGIQPIAIDEICDIIKEIADERGYTFIDINSVTSGKKDLYNRDLIHPNRDGARTIAQEIFMYISHQEA